MSRNSSSSAVFGSIALQQHGEVQFAEQPLVDVVHLRVAGEQDECPPARNLEQPPDAVGRFGRELRGARIRQVGRHIEQRLIFIVEVRRQDSFAGVLQSQPLAHVIEAAAHGQRRRGQHGAFQFVEQASLQNRSHVDRSGLEKNVMLVASAAPAFDPEDRVAVFGFHQEAELHLQLLGAPGEVENFFRLGRQILQLRCRGG